MANRITFWLQNLLLTGNFLYQFVFCWPKHAKKRGYLHNPSANSFLRPVELPVHLREPLIIHKKHKDQSFLHIKFSLFFHSTNIARKCKQIFDQTNLALWNSFVFRTCVNLKNKNGKYCAQQQIKILEHKIENFQL